MMYLSSLSSLTRILSIIFVVSILLSVVNCSGNSGVNSVSDPEVVTDSNEPTAGGLIWSDEFEGGVMSADWTAETGYGPGDPGWGNSESQLYTDILANLGVTPTVAGDEGGSGDGTDGSGYLYITARCDTTIGSCITPRTDAVTSARINTNILPGSDVGFEQTYGVFKARIKVPSGKSAWSAFWMLGAMHPEVDWPFVGEIDILEAYQTNGSNLNTVNTALHTATGGRNGDDPYTGNSVRTQPLSDDFHVYEVVWSEDLIIVKIDGEEYFRQAVTSAQTPEFRLPFFMILNLAIDGTLGLTPAADDVNDVVLTPQTMYVDWVRVYELGSGGVNLAAFEVDSPTFTPIGEAGGGVVANPDSDNINNSANVVRIFKNPDSVGFASAFFTLDTIDFSLGEVFTIDIYASRVVDVTLKLEDDSNADNFREIKVDYTTPNAWQKLRFDTSAMTNDITGAVKVVVFFDFDNPGAGEEFYFDNVIQGVSAPAPSSSTPIVVFDDAVGEQWDNGIRAFTTDGDTVCETSAACSNVDWEIIDDTDTARGKVIQISHAVGTLFAVPFIQSSDAVDLTAYANGDIIFDIKITALPDTISDPTFDMQIGCSSTVTDGVCTSGRVRLGTDDGLDVTSSEWQTVTIPVSRITDGMAPLPAPSFERLTLSHLNRITTGLEIFPTENKQSGVVFQLDNIRWTAPAPSSGGDDGTNLASFESGDAASHGVEDFGGGVGAIVDNPNSDSSGINPSAKVIRIIKNAGPVYSSSSFLLPEAVDISSSAVFTVDIYATRAVPVTFKLELDGSNSRQIEAQYTTPGAWQKLTFDLSGVSGNVVGAVKIAVFFDIENSGSGGDDWTFYFDNVIQVGESEPETPVDTSAGLLINSDFETGDLTGWEDTEGGDMATDEQANGDGMYSAKLTVPAMQGNTIKQTVLNGAADAIAEGEMFTLSLDVRGSIGNTGAVRVVILFETGPAARMELEVFTASIDSWESKTYTITAPAGVVSGVAGGVTVQLETACGGACEVTAFFDNVVLSRVELATTPTMAAPTPPTRTLSNVMSLFSEAYTDATTSNFFAFNGAGTTHEQIMVASASNTVLQYTALNYAGIGFEGANAINAASMTHFHMDIWTPDATGFAVELVDFGGGTASVGKSRTVISADTTPPLIQGEWTSVDVRLDNLMTAAGVAFTALDDLNQIVLDGIPDGVTVYLDNIYFYIATTPIQPAPTPPARAAENVISIYSDAYTPATGTIGFSISGSTGTIVETSFATDDDVQRLIDAVDLSIEGFSSIDLTTPTLMTHFHMDFWTADFDSLEYGLSDGGGDGSDTTTANLHSITTLSDSSNPAITQGSWVSIDVPLSEIIASVESGDTLTATPTDLFRIYLGEISLGTIYIDNIYFYADAPPSGIDGGFESGAFTDAWEVFPNMGAVTVSDEQENGGTYSAKLFTNVAPSNPVLKLANYMAGDIEAGDSVAVSFDYLVTERGPSGELQGRLQSERASDGASATDQYGTIAMAVTSDWQTFERTTVIGSGDVGGGISLEINGVCGAVTGCGITAYIDNVVVTVTR